MHGILITWLYQSVAAVIMLDMHMRYTEHLLVANFDNRRQMKYLDKHLSFYIMKYLTFQL